MQLKQQMPRAISIPGLLPSGMSRQDIKHSISIPLATAPEVSLDLILTQCHILELLLRVSPRTLHQPFSSLCVLTW